MAQTAGSAGYTRERFVLAARDLLAVLDGVQDVREARRRLHARVHALRFERSVSTEPSWKRIRARDCADALGSMLLPRSAEVSGVDTAQNLWDAYRGVLREDLQPAFWGDMEHMVRGLLLGETPAPHLKEIDHFDALEGREAARVRSGQLDELSRELTAAIGRYESGLSDPAEARRALRRARILSELGGSEEDWWNWRWQRDHVIDSAEVLAKVCTLASGDAERIRRARAGRLPFGVTPHYASLMDDDLGLQRDHAIRAQVIPPEAYVEQMLCQGDQRAAVSDFMREHDTSPVDLVTRRYPAIVILKPYNTCPQICVYCQRNWEIEEAMAPNALASESDIAAALAWIAARPTIREVLVTGGDPLALEDEQLQPLLERVAAIPHIELIRIGSRTPLTMPMRLTEELARFLGGLREPGRREVCLVTHAEHAYEITPATAQGIDRLKRAGIEVFNQLVFHFNVSRRFEAAALRVALRSIGISPYYTFAPKGKEETADYLVPIARLLQEQKEEARLLPGLRRTDEPVYNVPRLGKNHLRAWQHRDLLAIDSDGSRIYEFHPWEKYIVDRRSYVANDTPILAYLERLAAEGENLDDYSSIWYYY